MSLFITFEGGEGSGKSVQTRALYRRLSQLAVPTLFTQEPGGTPLGKKIARWLKWNLEAEISPLTELLLFNASRAQLVTEVIQPALEEGKIVICDRYTDSTTAYQSYGRGLDLAMVLSINKVATHGLEPELTILLDLPVEAGLARKSKIQPDRFEREPLAFHQRVRDSYLKLADSNPERWLVVDATLPRARVAGIIWQRVKRILSQQG